MKDYMWSESLCKAVLMDLCRRGVQNKNRGINRAKREQNIPVKIGRPSRDAQGIISSIILPLAAEKTHLQVQAKEKHHKDCRKSQKRRQLSESNNSSLVSLSSLVSSSSSVLSASSLI